jgi:hypothetical protein
MTIYQIIAIQFVINLILLLLLVVRGRKIEAQNRYHEQRRLTEEFLKAGNDYPASMRKGK